MYTSHILPVGLIGLNKFSSKHWFSKHTDDWNRYFWPNKEYSSSSCLQLSKDVPILWIQANQNGDHILLYIICIYLILHLMHTTLLFRVMILLLWTKHLACLHKKNPLCSQPMTPFTAFNLSYPIILYFASYSNHISYSSFTNTLGRRGGPCDSDNSNFSDFSLVFTRSNAFNITLTSVEWIVKRMKRRNIFCIRLLLTSVIQSNGCGNIRTVTVLPPFYSTEYRNRDEYPKSILFDHQLDGGESRYKKMIINELIILVEELIILN